MCICPNPPLADIVLFRLPLKVFKTRLLGRGFHTLIKNVSFSSPADVRSQSNDRVNTKMDKIARNLNMKDILPSGFCHLCRRR